jgi:transcriptional repressor NrdR
LNRTTPADGPEYAVICPYCGKNDDKVIDSRASDAGKVIRRRRECIACEKRFTTYERVEETARLTVVKRDGTRVPFSKENVLKGVMAACGKRPIPEEKKIALVDEVEEELHREYEREVPSRAIGELVAGKLRAMDEIAYVRFASEYYQFQSVGQVIDELRSLDSRPKEVKDQAKLFTE